MKGDMSFNCIKYIQIQYSNTINTHIFVLKFFMIFTLPTFHHDNFKQVCSHDPSFENENKLNKHIMTNYMS